MIRRRMRRSTTDLGKFFRSSFQFISAELIGRAAGLVTIPILTRYLSTEEMGELAIATLIAGLGTTAISFGLNGAVFRLHFTVAPGEHADLHTTLMRFGWILAGIVAAASLAAAFSPIAGAEVFGVSYAPLIVLGSLLAATSLGVDLVPSSVIRAEGRARAILSGQATSALVVIGTTTLFVAVLRLAAVGAIAARILATAAMGAVLLFGIRDFLRGRFQPTLLHSALRYGLPLLPHFLAHWALSGIDRFFIASELGLSDTGIYNVVYGLTAVMLAVVWAGAHALTPLIGATTGLTNRLQAEETAARATTWFIAGVLVVALCGIALRFELLGVVAGADYLSGAGLIPWLALAFATVGLYSPAVNVVNIIAGRPYLIGTTTLVAAGVNAAATYLLIQWIGLTGAAIATAIAYGVMLVGLVHAARNASNIPFDIRAIATLVTGSVLAGVILSVLDSGNLLARLAVGGSAALFVTATALHYAGRDRTSGLS